MKYKTLSVVGLTIAMSFSASSAFAEKTLNAEEAKALFTGKTFDGFNEIKGKSYQVYSDANGTMIHKNQKRTKEFTWSIDSEGRHCAHLKNMRCGKIISMGDGVYHKMRDGEHINTLKNFRDGNQLD